jgi:hypothetical protein
LREERGVGVGEGGWEGHDDEIDIVDEEVQVFFLVYII